MLPTLMLLFALLMQPVCVLFTRMIMRHAAAETARVAATSADDDVCRSFALRRLDAVPEVSLFHVGGRDDWQVGVERTDDGRRAAVEISGHVRPLPLMGVVMSALGERDATGVVVRERVSEQVRPSWLGGDYESWVGMW